jgi:hypothetical protein
MASYFDEKRGLVKRAFTFYRAPSVPTIRIAMKGNTPVLELGKRARLRDNSLHEGIERKTWDITSSPIPMIHGKQMEMGYLTHPSGCTLDLVPKVKVRAADDNGDPIKLMIPKLKEDGTPELKEDGSALMVDAGYKYIEANFEGTLGAYSDLDDFNESTPREQTRGWLMPFIVGGVAGVFFFAPMFAWFMSFVAQRATGS